MNVRFGTLALAALAVSLAGCITFGSGDEKSDNDIGMEFVLVPAGSFEMGCGPSDGECPKWEKPRHRVTISRPFFLGRYEVTQKQWAAVMGENPSEYKDDRRPVDNVSWDDAQEFVRRLNVIEKTGKYRLPTEAEWEYAARAGNVAKYASGDDAATLGDYAWFRDNAHEETVGGQRQTHPVGGKKPNALGLYDMYGNVWEWVQDRYADAYVADPVTNPKGPTEGAQRVLRGGSWNNNASNCRSAYRNRNDPSNRNNNIGFRVACVPASP